MNRFIFFDFLMNPTWHTRQDIKGQKYEFKMGSPLWGRTGAKASGCSAARQGGASATLTSRRAAAAAARVGGG